MSCPALHILRGAMADDTQPGHSRDAAGHTERVCRFCSATRGSVK